LPTGVSLAELEPVGRDAAMEIARRWTNAGPDPAPVARLGMSTDGIVDVDLVRDGPHGLVAGTTGSGKSELLRTLVVSLAAQVGPDHVTMILVDFKGGSTFDVCARLPHTVGVVTDLDDGLAERVLVSLDAEIRRRERLLRDAHVDDLTAYRRAVDDPLPRLVVVVDEFASLAKELPDFLGALVAIAQRGRSLGIHLLLATQRPAGVVTDDIRANTNLRIALRLQDRSDAVDVVGDAVPAGFPVGTPGRAALRLGPDELVVFQTADSAGALPVRSGRLRVERLGNHAGGAAPGAASPIDEPSVLEHLVDSICQAAAMLGTATPHRPWIDALPCGDPAVRSRGEHRRRHARRSCRSVSAPVDLDAGGRQPVARRRSRSRHDHRRRRAGSDVCAWIGARPAAPLRRRRPGRCGMVPVRVARALRRRRPRRRAGTAQPAGRPARERTRPPRSSAGREPFDRDRDRRLRCRA
jgi:DNA segregation ATPase FtsK/SpoIIIE, S-DNA-T family